jgi:hypothetical protein
MKLIIESRKTEDDELAGFTYANEGIPQKDGPENFVANFIYVFLFLISGGDYGNLEPDDIVAVTKQYLTLVQDFMTSYFEKHPDRLDSFFGPGTSQQIDEAVSQMLATMQNSMRSPNDKVM